MDTVEAEKKLYQCEDGEGDRDGIAPPPGFIHDSFTDPDWRRPRRDHILPTATFRARFGGNRHNNNKPHTHFHRNRGFPVDWRNAKVAAKHLKFCPGDSCRVWLPLYHFGSNFNMEDGLDIYCLVCNNTRREEKKGRRTPKVVVDMFVQFKDAYEKNEYNENRDREVEKRIEMAAIMAKGRFKREIPVDAKDVMKRLFDSNKYVCDVTGKSLTPKCFLDHHSITFEVRRNANNKKVLDVICSDCHVEVFSDPVGQQGCSNRNGVSAAPSLSIHGQDPDASGPKEGMV